MHALPVSLTCMSLNFEVRTLDFKLTYALTSYMPSVSACSGATWFQNFQCSLNEGNRDATVCKPSTLREPDVTFQVYDD